MSFGEKQIRPKNRWKSLISPINPWVIVCVALSVSSIVYPHYIWPLWLELFGSHIVVVLDIITRTRWTCFLKKQGTSTSLSLINPKTNRFFLLQPNIVSIQNHIHLFFKHNTLKVFETIDCVSHDQRFIFYALLKVIPWAEVFWAHMAQRCEQQSIDTEHHACYFFFQIEASVTSRQHKYRWDRVQIMFLTCAVPIEA